MRYKVGQQFLEIWSGHFIVHEVTHINKEIAKTTITMKTIKGPAKGPGPHVGNIFPVRPRLIDDLLFTTSQKKYLIKEYWFGTRI